MTVEENQRRAEEFYHLMNQRRSLRFFSHDPVPRRLGETLVKGRRARRHPGPTPSPGSFVAVSDAEIKEQIRAIVEDEEESTTPRGCVGEGPEAFKGNVDEGVPDGGALGGLADLQAPYTPLPDGRKINHYYHRSPQLSRVASCWRPTDNAGLVTLTSTPLNWRPRPAHPPHPPPPTRSPLLLLPLGYPAKGATVPGISRKPLHGSWTPCSG
ncbi:Iodotyrosine deiodinase 1 [Chionoecetes opilio]|uniref:Iodotyrosine deiodinase 1 n=1 Tax=Chionoecetes opilio TaxID=41210 RepID=A0A8J8WCG7_CHIOP|nr:Iodotyrosine deiodinase 1 [Chionoecetes opilio]